MLKFPQDLKKPQKIVLMFHGYGASGQHMIHLAPKFNIPSILWVAPNAPYKNGTGYQWFELDENLEVEEIQKGLIQVRPLIFSMIDSLQQEYKIDYEDIILLGFSQGAMLTLDVLTQSNDLRKGVAISGAFFPFENTKAKSKEILLIHGTNDQIVSFQYSVDAQQQLKERKAHVTLKLIPELDHHINQDVIDTISSFFTKS